MKLLLSLILLFPIHSFSAKTGCEKKWSVYFARLKTTERAYQKRHFFNMHYSYRRKFLKVHDNLPKYCELSGKRLKDYLYGQTFYDSLTVGYEKILRKYKRHDILKVYKKGLLKKSSAKRSNAVKNTIKLKKINKKQKNKIKPQFKAVNKTISKKKNVNLVNPPIEISIDIDENIATSSQIKKKEEIKYNLDTQVYDFKPKMLVYPGEELNKNSYINKSILNEEKYLLSEMRKNRVSKALKIEESPEALYFKRKDSLYRQEEDVLIITVD